MIRTSSLIFLQIPQTGAGNLEQRHVDFLGFDEARYLHPRIEPLGVRRHPFLELEFRPLGQEQLDTARHDGALILQRYDGQIICFLNIRDAGVAQQVHVLFD